MTFGKRINWALSTLGLLCVSVSLVLLFAIPVYAACNATATCGSGAASCNCSSGGTCLGGNGYALCTCNDPEENSSAYCEPIIP